MEFPIHFNLEEVMTWGLEVDYRYGGYKLPLVLKYYEQEREKISILAETNNARNPFYGRLDTIYLRVYNLTKKQEKEILYKGRLNLHVKFSLIEIGENKKGDKFLNFEVTGLKRIGEISSRPAPKDL